MRLPLAVSLASRDGTVTKDAKVLNGLIEKLGQDAQGNGVYDLLARPGQSDAGQIGPPLTAQMLYVWNNLLYTIYGDALARSTLTSFVTFGTWNSADKGSGVTLSNGNLTASFAAVNPMVRATQGFAVGKWYWEVTVGSLAGGAGVAIGIAKSAATLNNYLGSDANGWSYYGVNGNKINTAVSAAYGSSFTTGDVIGVAVEVASVLTVTITFYKNGVSQGAAYTGLTAGTFYPAVSGSTAGTEACTVNFGATAFVYTPPAGYSAVTNATPFTHTSAGLQHDAQETAKGVATSYLAFKNRTQLWTAVVSGGAPTERLAASSTQVGSYVLGFLSLTRSGTTATAAYSAVGQIIAAGDSVIVANANDANYNGTFTVTAIGFDGSGNPTFSYTVAGSPPSPDPNYVYATIYAGLVPGMPYINGYFCVMNRNGQIYHSPADDPTSWPTTNVLTARGENGAGVALARSLNYLVALKEWSTEFFYDAHNPTGSAFSAVENGLTRIGCASGDSVAVAGSSLCWVAQTKAYGRSVYAMQGLQQQKISTPDIDRILNAATLTTVYAYGVDIQGRTLYLLTLATSNITLVYDFGSQTWGQWSSLTLGTALSVSSITRSGTTATVTTSGAHGRSDGDPILMAGANQSDYNGIFQIQYVSATVFTIEVANSPTTPATGTITATPYTETYFKMTKAATYQGSPYFLHETNGHLYKMDATLYQDAGIPINCFGRTTRIDGGAAEVKKMVLIRVIGDVVSSTAMIRWSDDDSATFAPFRIVDLSVAPFETRKCGSFRRRSLEFRHVKNAALRVRALEMK